MFKPSYRCVYLQYFA